MTTPRLKHERTQPVLNPMRKSIDPCKEDFEAQAVIPFRRHSGIPLLIFGMDHFATTLYNCAS